MRRSKQLTADADAIKAFLHAYGRFRALETPQRGTPAENLRQLVEDGERLRAEVNRVAGQAADAIDRAGFAIQIGGMTVNPVRSWRTAERYGANLTQRAVADFAEQSEATIRGRAAASAQAERTLAGRVAALARFPSEVRDQVGTSSRATRRAAFSFAVVLETVVGGVLLAGVLAATKRLVELIWG